jgi:hypothetical protein
MDDQDINEEESSSLLAPMGEGRNPRKEIIGWSNQRAWGQLLASDVGLDVAPTKWKKNPEDHIMHKPLIKIGETEKKSISIFLSEADDRTDGEGGALYLHNKQKNQESE